MAEPAPFTIPPDFTIPPGVTIPDGFTLPPGGTFAPGAEIPDFLLPGGVNGTEGGLFDTGGGDALGPGGFNIVDLNSMDNATPVFLTGRLQNYDRAPATSGMSSIPRFGHTNDFSYLAYLSNGEGNKSDGEDYIYGLLFVGLFLFVFFLIWSIVLVIFKFSLRGFLSGMPFLNPWIDDPAELKRKEEVEEDGEEYIEDVSWKKQPFRIRITFFIAGLLQIIFAMLMVTKGVANLQQTTDTIQLSTSTLQLLIDEAVQTMENLKQVGETGYILRDQLVFDLDRENFCPDNPIFGATSAGQGLLAAADGAVAILDQMGDFVGENTKSLEEGLLDATRNLDEVNESIVEAESNEWLGGLIAFPYLVLSSLMMVGVVAAQLNAMTDCFLCVLNWVILPIFMFVTLMSYVGLVTMSIVSSANADFCGGASSTPDQVILDAMFRSGFAEDDLFYQITRYYANQCTSEAIIDPFIFLRSFDGALIQGKGMVQNFTNALDGASLEQLSLACNRDFAPLQRSLAQMVGVMEALIQASERTINLLRCDRIVPVYTDIVYGATCTHSVTGFTWLFSSLLIVSVMGMIMIMFRSSYQNTIFTRPPALMDESSGENHHRTKSSRSKSDRSRGSDQWSDER